jgi:hypothetical protein
MVLVAGATAAARCRRRGAFFLGLGGSIPAFEVAGIPAVALELEAGGGQLLGKSRGMALRTLGEWIRTHFLHDVFRMPACGAAICINRHDDNSLKKQNYTLIGSRYLNVGQLKGFKGNARLFAISADKKKEQMLLRLSAGG